MAREVLEGRIFSSNNYGDFKVLNYLGNYRYTIQFIKTNSITEVSANCIIEGEVKDKFYPSICGIGCIGEKYKRDNPLYSRWNNMVSRCYNKDSPDYPNYGAKGIKVCDRWHNFTNYVEDVILLEGYNEDLVKTGKLQLDKDVINREALIYSPETCKWLTKSDNFKEMLKRVKQKPFIATRLSDNYIEEHYNITEFCNLHNIKGSEPVSTCLLGKRNDYMGWKFEYKENPIKYIHETMSTNKSGYKGICKTTDGKKWRATVIVNKKQTSLGHFTDIKDAIIARYNWEVENQGVYRKPDSKDDYLKEVGYIVLT